MPNFALNTIQANSAHVSIAAPNIATNGDGSVNSVKSTNAIRINSAQKYLNETAHRHSFNESIYSEPYGNRFATVNSNRLEFNQQYQSLANAISDNLNASSLSGSSRIRPEITKLSPIILSPRDSTNRTIVTSPAIDVNSTRSSVCSDRTLLSEQSTSTTSLLADSREQQHQQQTNKLANQSNKVVASNAPGSQFSLQSSNSTIYATAEFVAGQSNTIKECVETEQSKSVKTLIFEVESINIFCFSSYRN